LIWLTLEDWILVGLKLGLIDGYDLNKEPSEIDNVDSVVINDLSQKEKKQINDDGNYKNWMERSCGFC
jgi:hypothetical protein